MVSTKRTVGKNHSIHSCISLDVLTRNQWYTQRDVEEPSTTGFFTEVWAGLREPTRNEAGLRGSHYSEAVLTPSPEQGEGAITMGRGGGCPAGAIAIGSRVSSLPGREAV